MLIAAAALFGWYGLIVLERGFDDGPFYARPYVGPVPARAPDQEIQYRDGYLQVYNEIVERGTTMCLMVKADRARKAQFAQLLDVTTNPRYDCCELTSISIVKAQVAKLDIPIARDHISIHARWTFGYERGMMYLWNGGKVHRFYLSW